MKSVFKNSIANVINQIITLSLMIVVRLVLIKNLGIDYQGLDAVMLSIVSILSLADLGIGTASVYALYKPLASNQFDKIRSLMHLYKKIYSIIIVSLLFIGSIVCIFVPYLIKDSYFSPTYIREVFFLFLLQTASSYLFAEYSSLLFADQKNYYNSLYRSIISIVSATCQIAVIVLLQEYRMKIITVIVFNVLTSILIRQKALKEYPFIKEKDSYTLERPEKKSLFTDFKNLSVSRIADVLIFQTDNLFVSKMIGETTVGVYSNYFMIINGVNSLINCIIAAVQPSLTNHFITSSEKEKTQTNIFNAYSTFALFLSFFCACSYYFLINDFIILWIGKEYTLSTTTVYLLIATQLILLLDNPLWMMMYINGAFNEIKKIGFTASVINIIFSFIFTLKLGLNGVVLGTVVCYLFSIICHFCYAYKHIGNKKVIAHYLIQIIKYGITTSVFVFAFDRINLIILSKSVSLPLKFAINCFACLFVANLINYSLNNHSFKNALSFFRSRKVEYSNE